MTVLTIASSKGGPGKTTVCMLLAGRLAGDGLRVAALDADPACALMRWATHAYEGPALLVAEAEADETRLAHLIDAQGRSADVVLVDTAGFGNRAAAVAMTSADAVLIPALSGEADITEAERTVRLVEGLARAARRDIPARVLLNRVKRTRLSRHALGEIETAGLPVLSATLSDLIAYGEMTFSGRVPDNGVAGDEITRLVVELRALRWVPGINAENTSAGTIEATQQADAG
jgi:chromosome partitioning protein